MLTFDKFKDIKSRMTEGLKGDQHKLDHDKDGKIEGEDLAKLRKMKKEETEQLDELSKETLGSYKHKAETSIPKDDRDYANRSKGIAKAEKKMKKEETSPFDEFTLEELQQFMQTEDYEQLDELSKSTLGSYVKKASDNAAMHAADYGKYGKEQKSLYGGKSPSYAKAVKRLHGVSKATDRLTKEAHTPHTAYSNKAVNNKNGEDMEPRPPIEKEFKAKHTISTYGRRDADNQDGGDKAPKATPPGTVTSAGDKSVVKPLKSFKSFSAE